jgi:hypothetical protein
MTSKKTLLKRAIALIEELKIPDDEIYQVAANNYSGLDLNLSASALATVSRQLGLTRDRIEISDLHGAYQIEFHARGANWSACIPQELQLVSMSFFQSESGLRN